MFRNNRGFTLIEMNNSDYLWIKEQKLLKRLIMTQSKEQQEAIKSIIGKLNSLMTRIENKKKPPQ